MDNKNTEIEEALAAVRNIRQSIKSNVALVRPLFLDKSYIALCLAASIGMALLAVWQIIVKNCFTQNGIALGWTNYISLFYIAILFVVATLQKFLLVKKYAKENGNYTAGTFLRLPEIFNLLVDSIILLGSISILCIILSYKLNTFGVFLPGALLYIGVISIIAGDMYSIIEYRFSGIMTLAFSIIVSTFMKGDYLLWVACVFCVYFASLCFVVKIAHRNK